MEKLKCPKCREEFETLLGQTINDIFWMVKYFNENRLEINPKNDK